MNMLEQKEVTVGGKLYILTALPAEYGLDMQMKLQNMAAIGQPPSAEMIKATICKGASLASAKITSELFDKHFARKYGAMLELFAEICKFNFEEDEGPNGESDTSDQ